MDSLKKGLTWGREELEDGFEEGKQMLQSGLGLGHRPNVVPPGKVNIKCEPRTVEIGWHPVAGMAGKWFAEKCGIGKMITEEINKCPDPTQHWAILVGDYAHELWMDEHFDVIYINEVVNRDDWHTFKVGKTRFNDEALRNAGEMTISAMRENRPAYNLIDNNCQIFAQKLLDRIRPGKHREFATSFAVWKQVTDDPRKIDDLFEDNPLKDNPDDEPEKRPNTPPQGMVKLAQNLMDEHTPRLKKKQKQKQGGPGGQGQGKGGRKEHEDVD